MNRCIQCTRCVRFVTEVAGVPELGAIGRGEDMEITTYLERAMTSELQGNVVDLCPVGALTSKPYEFHARPWEFAKTESVDVMDALGSAIRIDSRGREVVRILPRINEAINEEWISDKTRHVVRRPEGAAARSALCAGRRKAQAGELAAGLRRDRRQGEGGAAAPDRGDRRRSRERRGDVRAQGADGQARLANIDCRQDGSKLHPKFGRASYLFNSTIAGIDQADAIMIIGSNPRLEAPVLNARIRKRWLKGGVLIGVIGERADLTYTYNYLGAGPETLAEFADHPPAGKTKPMFIVGAGAFARPDGEAVLARLAKAALAAGVVKDGWNGFNVLHTAASARRRPRSRPRCRARAASTRWQWRRRARSTSLFNLGADEIDIEPGAFVVYIGTHGDRGAHRADVILPGAAYTEKTGIYVEHRGPAAVRRARGVPAGRRARGLVDPARLSDPLGARLPYDLLAQLRATLAAAYPHLVRFDVIEPADPAAIVGLSAVVGAPDKAPFVSAIHDFYLTNPIARASRTMAECSALAQGHAREAAE